MKIKTIILGMSLLVTSNAFAEIAVVVHPSNASNVNQDFVSSVYLGKTRSFEDGKQIIPVNLSGTTMEEDFNKKVLGKSSSQMKAYWSKLVFTGKGTPPKDAKTDADVISLVSENPATIGYVDASSVTDKVKVVFTIK